MTIVDFFFFIFFLVIAFIGFSIGVIKMGSFILGMYLGLQLAALLYIPFAGLTAKHDSPYGDGAAQVVWFGVLWFVGSIIFTLIVLSFTRYILLPKWLKNAEQLAGLVLGMIAAIFFLLVLGFAMQNSFALFLAASQCKGGFVQFFAVSFRDSFLMHIFNAVKVVFVNVLSPWLPTDKNGATTLPVFQNDAQLVSSCGV